jgi:hypothetical protein
MNGGCDDCVSFSLPTSEFLRPRRLGQDDSTSDSLLGKILPRKYACKVTATLADALIAL